ncbi:flexible cuticle protein 12-like [Battus philenor]|uniref:flexible cuticle protein 12-like n=1 Tax=Battus philenor TaxID=42288 RepID=UPI0035CF614D
MKSVFVFALFVAAAVALPVNPKEAVVVVNEFDNIGVDGFAYKSETSDGKFAAAEGHLKSLGPDGDALEVTGEYSYVGDDGITYRITYVANEKGFQPEGAHIPKN